MSEKALINFPNRSTGIANAQDRYPPTRARSFKIKTSEFNYPQYVRTVNAYELAGMTFNDIANAGDFLEDEVERKETDVPLQEDWNNKVGEVAENESQILAWQTRGEKASITRQLPSSQSVTGREVITISQGLTTKDEPTQEQMRVIEGINVSLRQDTPSALPTSTLHDQELKNNPYLKKAA